MWHVSGAPRIGLLEDNVSKSDRNRTLNCENYFNIIAPTIILKLFPLGSKDMKAVETAEGSCNDVCCF